MTDKSPYGIQKPGAVKYTVIIHCPICKDAYNHWVFEKEDEYSKCQRCGHEQLY